MRRKPLKHKQTRGETLMKKFFEDFKAFGGLFIALDGGSYVSAEAAAAAGVGTINYGLFIQNIVNFILTAFCMFLVIRAMNKVYKKPEPAPEKPKRICPFCKSEIADDATRCPHCTSMLE